MTTQAEPPDEEEFTQEEAEMEAARIYFRLWPLMLPEPQGPLAAALALLLVEVARPGGWSKDDLLELVTEMYDRSAKLDLAEKARKERAS